MRARLVACVGVSVSAGRLDVDAPLCSFVRRHESNGLFRLVGLSGFDSSASLLADLVVRLVSGGDTGANLGASGVLARF